MKLDTLSDQAEVLALALDAARAAARIVHAGWRKHPIATHKGAIDLVTEYDLASERYLRERLSRETPFAVVGEEQGGERAAGDGATFFVDPIDGTTNFVHGHPFFCVSIGLFAAGRPLLGAIVAPALGLEYTGLVGRGATRNGEPCTVSRVSLFSDAFLATGFPYDRRTSDDNNFDAFVAIKKEVTGVRRCGAAALDLALVADGTYDGYWERKLRVWDLAAGAAMVLAAGGSISAFDGGPADVTQGHLVATNGIIHRDLVAALMALPSIPHRNATNS